MKFLDMKLVLRNLIGLEEKQLQWFGHLNRMDRPRMLRGELHLQFKGERHMR
jgi:hypothetical protein